MGEHQKSRKARDTILEYLRKNPGSTAFEVGYEYYESLGTSDMKWNRSRGGTWAKRHLRALQEQGLAHQKKRGEWYSTVTTPPTLDAYKGRSNFLDAVIESLEAGDQVSLTKPMFEALIKDIEAT